MTIFVIGSGPTSGWFVCASGKASGRNRRDASQEDMRIFESVAGDVLSALNDERLYVPQGVKTVFSQEEIRRFDAENLRLKEEPLPRTSADDLKRRDRQAGLIQDIRDRGQMSPPSMRAIA